MGVILSRMLSIIPVTNKFFSILTFTVSSILMAIFTYKRDWFDEKYGLVSRYHIGMNYSVIFYLILIITVTLSLMFFYPILKSQGLKFAAIMFISQYIPVIFMLLRLKVFSDENCPVKKTDNFGNEYWKNTLGYNPIIYYLISFPFTMIIALSLYNYTTNILSSSYLTSNLLYLILSLTILFILLSPDFLDKVLPLDLRTWKGTGQLIVLIVVILSILRWFII